MSEIPTVTVESATGYSDEDGLYVLVIAEDGNDIRLRMPTPDACAHLLAALAPAAEWVDDRDRHWSEYRRATPEERAKVLGQYEAAGFSVRWDRLCEEAGA